MKKNQIYLDWMPTGEVKKTKKRIVVFIPEDAHKGHLPGVPFS